jgi:hypothetical protein
MAGEILRQINLPTPENFPDKAITSASRGRWGEPKSPGSLPNMLVATQAILDQDGIGTDRVMMISDGSDTVQKVPREPVLASLEDQLPESIFFLTPELQAVVVDKVVAKTGLPKEVVKKVLFSPEYDGNRLRLDAVQSGVVSVSGGEIKSLSLDDDVIPPNKMKVVKPEKLIEAGLKPNEPNSFVFWVGKPLEPDDFIYQDNSLAGFFDPLGHTIEELQTKYPDMTVSKGWTDEMHRVMEDLRKRPEAFHVTHVPGKLIPIPEASDVVIQSVTNTKTRLPDPRTVRYIEQLLMNELMPPEARIFSYIAGPQKPFAFFKAGTAGSVTNVDSANMSWRFASDTTNIVRWFPSDPKISKKMGIVDWQYRSDNEWLPMYLVALWKKLGRRYAYFTGIAAETEHHRATTGYRPTDPAEPAASSLVGHEVSEAALGRMEFDKFGRPSLNLDGIEGWVVPKINAQRVWLEMRNLQLICSETIVEAHKRLKGINDPKKRTDMLDLIHKYDEIYESIRRRISGRDFDEFYERINEETRRQLRFTDQVLRAYPTIVETVGQLIKDGEYPVLEYRPPKERNKNYPNGGRRSSTVFKMSSRK